MKHGGKGVEQISIGFGVHTLLEEKGWHKMRPQVVPRVQAALKYKGRKPDLTRHRMFITSADCSAECSDKTILN